LVPGIAAEVAGVDRESPEMLSARAQLSEGRAALAKLRGGEQAPAAKPNVIKISTDAEYDGLASGTVFVGPDGVTRRKP
jgi:hypothetical protein